MLLAEFEIFHSRPIAPTRRLALGRLLLPVEPTPGFGGILLGAVLAVHIAEVDSFLAAHAKFGEIELSPEQRDGYVLDMSRIASALGVIDPPTTVAELADQIAA